MMQKAQILQVGALPAAAVALLSERFSVVDVPALDVPESAAAIRGIATSGKVAIDAALLDRLPNLRVVSCLGAGTDGLDMALLERRGIGVTNTSAVLAADVADVAMGLMIGLARDLRRADRFVRDGRWREGKYPLGVALAGARLGIIGLGSIGSAVAARAAAFGMEIGYHNRSPRPDVPHGFFDSVAGLAAWSRFLVVSCPGSAATRHLVNAEVLATLGADSFLINVSRGSVVDETALIAALADCRIAGAGLDVFEDEPSPNPALIAQERAIFLPHIGSATGETRDAMAHAMVEALVRELA
jgi:lactate dehydrogenase-like 2-hydroxyacid dehydrogenase